MHTASAVRRRRAAGLHGWTQSGRHEARGLEELTRLLQAAHVGSLIMMRQSPGLMSRLKKRRCVMNGASKIVFFCVVAIGCGPVSKDEATESGETSAEIQLVGDRAGCGVAEEFTTPVAAALFAPGSYRGRDFLDPASHLGTDIVLAEGTEITSVASGRIAYYGPATGYGELLAAVEYDLGREMEFTSGDGETVRTQHILVIYGHLRAARYRLGSPLRFVPGDCVAAGQTIGYVNDDEHNGDGAEHLHFGVRLMSATEARAADGRYAFRGYDSEGRFRGDFTDPSEVVVAAALGEAPVDPLDLGPRWHPNGALIQMDGSPDIYLITEGGVKQRIANEDVFYRERFWTGGARNAWHKVIEVSRYESACYASGSDVTDAHPRWLVACPDGTFLADSATEVRRRIEFDAGTREYDALVRSWGFVPADRTDGSRSVACSYAVAIEPLFVRDGTLIKEDGELAVYVMTNRGEARRIENEGIMHEMGYKDADILLVPDGSLGRVVRTVGSIIALFEGSRCVVTDCAEGCDDLYPPEDPGVVADEGPPPPEEPPPADDPPDDPPPPPDDPAPPGDRTLAVALGPALAAECRSGYVIVAWDNLGRPVESMPAAPLVMEVGDDWRGFIMMTVRCGGEWRDWTRWLGASAYAAGIRSVHLDGVELGDAETRICRDLWAGGAKPAIPLDPSLYGRCP